MRSTIIGILAAVVTVAIGVTLVKAQLIFADGSVQTTAAVSGERAIASGDNFASVGTINVLIGGQTHRVATPAVPAGKELVVLSVKYFVSTTGENTIDPIRIGTWDFLASSANFLSFIVPPHQPVATFSTYKSAQNSVDNVFPDGALIVNTGDTLVLENSTGEVSVLGYYRDVP